MSKRRRQPNPFRTALTRVGAAFLCVAAFSGMGLAVSSMSRGIDQDRFIGVLNNASNYLVVRKGDHLSGSNANQNERSDFATLARSLALDSSATNPLDVGVDRPEAPIAQGESLFSKDLERLSGSEFEKETIDESEKNGVVENDFKDGWQDELALTPYETPKFEPLPSKAWNDNLELAYDSDNPDDALPFAPSTLVKPDGSLTYKPAPAQDSTRFFAETKAERNSPAQRGGVSQVEAVLPSKANSFQSVSHPVYVDGFARDGALRRGAAPGTGVVSIDVD